MQHYVALIHKDADSDFGVSFPDFPGAITAGRTLDEARDLAAEALGFHIKGMVEDGEAVPEPSSLDAIMADPENREGVAILVSVAPQTVKAVRINITIQEDVLREIDAFAEAHGLTRSGFLANAAKKAIEREPV
jgi:predicted RNase H-like HicB family nuclease